MGTSVNVTDSATTNTFTELPTPTSAGGVVQYMLYLPTYNGVSKLLLAHPPGTVLRNASRGTPRLGPVVWYGTSIAQGCAASRPGMAFTNQIGRALDRDVLNFGFSANGIMEPSVMTWLLQIKPVPSAFVSTASK